MHAFSASKRCQFDNLVTKSCLYLQDELPLPLPPHHSPDQVVETLPLEATEVVQYL